MRWLARTALLTFTLAAAVACARLETRDHAFRRQLRCADRLTDQRSLAIFRKARFVECDPLPPGLTTVAQARIFYLQKAWDLKPESPLPPTRMAFSYWEEENLVQAARHFDAARTRDPSDLDPVIGLITILRIQGECGKALQWVRSIEPRRGVDAQKVCAYFRGRIAYEQKDYAAAEPLLRHALERAEKGDFFLGGELFTMRDAEFHLAQIAVKSGRTAEADALFRQYVKRNRDPDFMAYMQWLFDRGSQDLSKLYDEIETSWVRERQE